MISLVVAHARNRVIGRAGGLPWRLPTDLRRFRELTSGHAVVMGRRTFESLPDALRPLPERRNLVLSGDRAYVAPGAEVFGGLRAALDACAGGERFVIGGGRTYAQALPLAQRVYATELEADVDGDTYFPPLDAGWRLVDASAPLTENGHAFAFKVYERAPV